MLSFIFGTDETQKLNEIYKLATADAQKSKSVFILVPEQYSMYAESLLINTLGLSAQNKIQILTFSRLCNLIFSKMGPLRTKYMDKAGKFIVTRRALNLCSKDMTFFTRSLNRHGFTGMIRNTISEFKRYGVSPSALANSAQNTSDRKFSAKLRDLSVIYEKFNELVEKEHSNSEDNLTLIIPRIKDAAFLRGSFYVTFFKSFTPTEHDVLLEIMKQSDLCVALSSDSVHKSSPIFSTQQKTYEKLKNAAKDNGITFSGPYLLSESDSMMQPSELIHLKQNFFLPAPKAFEGIPSHVHFSRPASFREEVTECAQLIKQLVREKKYSYNDILILTGNTENYDFLIPQIFEEHEISYFLDKKIPMTESPFMRMMIAVLEILAYGISYERIMLIARSGFFPVSTSDIDKFENYILAADIPHSLWNSRDEWTYNPDKYKFNMELVNKVKEKLLHPILKLSDMFSGRKTAKIIHDNLCKWMQYMNIPETVSKKINEFREDNLPESAEQLRLIWNAFVSVNSQLCSYMGDEYFTFAEYYEMFISACGELSVGMVPPTQDKVIISTVDIFRSVGTKAVIVLGALDGVFPRDYATEGLISDAERNQLKDMGIDLAPDTFSQQQEEQFLIYSVITAANEHLYISAPLSDRDGKLLRPSEIVHTLKDVFPHIKDESEENAHTNRLESRNAAFNGLSLELFKNKWDISKLSPLWKTVYDLLENDTEYAPKLAKLHQMHTSETGNTPISISLAKKLYGSDLVFSVSKLEKYNACAFSFFMRYGLLAEERLMGGLNSSDTGNILHSVLCDYFKSKSEGNTDYGAISREQCYSEISALVDKAGEITNENLYSASNHYKYMMLRIKNIATATAWKMINFYSHGDFRPTGFEISFGENATYPPYKLGSKHGEVSLKGFIDRVDTATIDGKDYISVFDYKSSERHLDMDLAEAGIHFQPFVYANALTSHMSETEVAAMFYLQMNDPIINFDTNPTQEQLEKEVNDEIKAHGKIVNDPKILHSIDNFYDDKNALHYIKCDKASLMEKEIFEKSLEDADKKATETTDKILDGIIDINPVRIKGFDPCLYCPYGGICNK